MARIQQPDLILMDMQLPGMDGLEATRLLKQDEATRAIPVIALTALAMNGDEDRIRAAGCDGYIAKPMHYPDFLATIAAQLALPTDRRHFLSSIIAPMVTKPTCHAEATQKPKGGGGRRRDGGACRKACGFSAA